jgi:hypothetical protein
MFQIPYYHTHPIQITILHFSLRKSVTLGDLHVRVSHTPIVRWRTIIRSSWFIGRGRDNHEKRNSKIC